VAQPSLVCDALQRIILNNGSSLQVEVDLFELLCKVLDQNLFAQVDWARNSYYFKELKVGGRIQQHRDCERKKERKCPT
jgi:hypothetical protein